MFIFLCLSHTLTKVVFVCGRGDEACTFCSHCGDHAFEGLTDAHLRSSLRTASSVMLRTLLRDKETRHVSTMSQYTHRESRVGA